MTADSNALHFHYDVDGNNFTSAGEASVQVKRMLRQMGYHPDLIRRISIAMYEGEINMVIHAKGGDADVYVTPDCITVILKDVGPGIKDVNLAMQEGYSTATSKIREMGFGAGMGLCNIKKFSDLFQITSEIGKGTHLKMVINIANNSS